MTVLHSACFIFAPAFRCGVSGRTCHKKLRGISGQSPMPEPAKRPSLQHRRLGAVIAFVIESQQGKALPLTCG
jgi:hypothetical protein